MVSFFEATLDRLSIHRIGNKALEEFYVLSDQPFSVDDDVLSGLLMQYFLKPFEKVHDVYRFMHSSDDLELNEVYHFIKGIFEQPGLFHENSQQLARFLYEVSSHPKIKSGEMYVAEFNNVQIEGEPQRAIGIFKSETKEPFLKIYPESEGFKMAYEQEAVNIHKLDKGCLVFISDMAEGFKVVVTDQTNKSSEAVYWKDDFLKLKIRNDSFNQTNNTLAVYKNFVNTQLDEEFELSKTDKIDLQNKAMNYFKEKESFDLDEFSNEVLGHPEAIESFKSYKSSFEQEFETEIPESFDISDAAVKKNNKAYKTVLKLDKNFHIYIHGSRDLIEKGQDEEKGMNYYKLYFKEEE